MKQKKASKPIPAPHAESRWPLFWPYLLLIGLAFGVYANALGDGFVSDDHFQLLGNPLVTDWHRIPEIFQHHIWAFAGGQTSNYYRPIQTLVYLLLYSCFGFNAFAFHFAIVLIHAANTVLVYMLGRRLLKSHAGALVAGILFAVHPIHSEAVVWIAVLPDVLLTLVMLAALLWFARCDASPRGKQIAGLAALSFLALLIKEPGAMLLPLLAGYEFLYLRRPVRQMVRANGALYAALIGTFGVYLLLRIHALGGLAPAQGVRHDLHGAVFVLSLVSTLGQYFAALVAPIHLNYFHYFEPTTSLTPLVILSLLAVLCVIAAIIVRRSYALFFVVAALLPALNLNGVGENVFAERYLYLPSVGFVLLAAVAWEWLASRQRIAAWGALGVIVVASAWILAARNLDWHDDERLLTATVASSPKAMSPLSDLGTYHYARGEYDAAISNYQAALKLQPDNAELHHNLGNSYERKGSYPEAVSELRRAVELSPNYAEAHMSLGLALDESGDPAGAITEDQKALALKPDYPEALANLAMVRIKQRDYATAIDLLHRALAANPRSFEALFNLGVACNYSNRYREAAETFQKAIEVAPEHPNVFMAHFQLGISYAELNAVSQAADEFTTTLQLKPDFTPARDALALAQSRLNQDAKKGFRQ